MINHRFNKKLLLTILSIFGVTVFFISCKKFNKADKKYNRYEYSDAIPLYKRALKHEDKDPDYWAKLGDCYKKNNQIPEAENCYANAAISEQGKSIYKFHYAQMLMSNEKYDKALEWMEKYMKEVPNDSWGNKLAKGLAHIDDFFVNKDKYIVDTININSAEAEYGPAFYKDGIIFTSSRKADDKKMAVDEDGETIRDGWTGKNFYSLFYSKRTNDTFEQPVIFLEGIPSVYHNTSACFNKEGTVMFLTRNSVKPKPRGLKLKLQIYSSTLSEGLWSDVKPFPYNSDNYSCAHPALSLDGNRLYFSSDMPGSVGGMDIWESRMTNEGWGTPINLGPKVNTAGNEVFPTVAEDGTLYFSSNGLEGIGGLDIYATRDTFGTFTDPVNMGAPYNSSDDDFGLIVDTKNDIGYLSSNRKKKDFNDDIFSIQKNKLILNGEVVDNSDRQIDSAKISILIDGNPTASVTTDNGGKFTQALEPGNNYKVVLERGNYQNDTVTLSSEQIRASGNTLTMKFGLQDEAAISGRITHRMTSGPLENMVVNLINLSNHDTITTTAGKDGIYKFSNLTLGTPYRIAAGTDRCELSTADVTLTNVKKMVQADLQLSCSDEEFALRNIYYDLNKYNIRPDASKELDKLAKILKQHPDMILEINSYSDCRGSAEFNLSLSQRRAASAVAYLESRGIDHRRLIPVGYGEMFPINKCSCDKNPSMVCTEEEYQRNRRTEFKLKTPGINA